MFPERFLLRPCGNKGFLTHTNCFNKTLCEGKVVPLLNYGSNRESLVKYIFIRQFGVVECRVFPPRLLIILKVYCACVNSLMSYLNNIRCVSSES
jgi:hypothetical protein